MSQTKKWCDVCKFMTYGNCHNQLSVTRKGTRNGQPLTDKELASVVWDNTETPREEGSTLILVPFGPVGIPGCSTTLVKASPQVAGQPLHLAVDPLIAPDFRICDIRFGIMSQFATVGGVGASYFAPHPENRALYENLKGMDPWKIGHEIFLLVENANPAMRWFNAVMRARPLWAPAPRIEMP
jgi:hypothetical protein